MTESKADENTALLKPRSGGNRVRFADESLEVVINRSGVMERADDDDDSGPAFFDPSKDDAKEAVAAMQPDTSGRGMSFFGAAMNMVKLMLGAGCLALPNAFSKAGLWAAVVLYPTLGAVAWFTMMLLLDTKNEACRAIRKRRKEYREALINALKTEELKDGWDEGSGDPPSSAATDKDEASPPASDTVKSEEEEEKEVCDGEKHDGESHIEIDDKDANEEDEDGSKGSRSNKAYPLSRTYGALDSVSYTPEDGSLDIVRTYRGVGAFAFGAIGKWTVIISVVILQLCFCSGYVIVSSNTFEAYFPALPRALVVFVIIMPLCGMLAMIRWIKDLTIVAVFGTIVYIVGVIGVTFFYGLPIVFKPNAPDFTEPVIWSSLPLFIGTALYSIEGINGVLPIETAMERPNKAPTAMLIATMGYVSLVAVFSIVAYAAGFGVFDIVTRAFPRGVLRGIIEWALVVSLILTYPLQLFPATETLEEQLQIANGRAYKRFILRITLVIVTVSMAFFMKDFSLFSGLVGSLFLSFAGFIVPALAYMKVIGRDHGLPKLIAAGAIFVCGIFLLVMGTYRSVAEIIAAL